MANPQQTNSPHSLSEGEQHQLLVEWNATQREYPKDKCIHQLFEAQVERTPKAIALVFGEQHLTYCELNHKANHLAHYLQTLGVGPEVLVGLCVERSIEMVVGLLAVLKAGGAYVPLDPAYPTERLTFMLQDSQVAVLLTQERLLPNLPEHSASLVCLDTEWEHIAEHSETNVQSGVKAENLAYVIYTSGSTGQPKGVAIEHHNVVNFLSWTQQAFNSQELAGVLASTSICFDLSIFELFGPLSQGGKANLMENILYLPNSIAGREVTLINTVPSAMTQILKLDSLPPSVGIINLAGEALQMQLVQRLYQQSSVQQVFNLYGPSESTTYSTYALINKDVTGVPTIGRPIANTQLYVLDQHMQPVPVGVPGELYIGGAGVARGYLHRPELTAEKFVPNPFGHEPNARLYKTGDLVRYLPDGDLEFLGRLDHQVKIRGFRIELGEIEAALVQHPAVREAIVVAREHVAGDQRLVAYLVAAQPPAPSSRELRNYLQERLPDYMLPTAFVPLEALPLTSNGKVDRQSLPQPEQTSYEGKDIFVAPRDKLELQLARIWEEVLHTEPIGVKDNFFDLGGDSLRAAQIITRLQQSLYKKFSLATLLQNGTIEQLAHIIRSQVKIENWHPVVKLQPEGTQYPFFVIPGQGGDLMSYVDLALLFRPDQPLFGLQAPGLYGEQEPCTQFEELVTLFIQAIRAFQPEGPYLLGGYSSGGYVAFEIARKLETQGQKVALLVLFDTASSLEKTTDILDDAVYWYQEFCDYLPSLSLDHLKSLAPEEHLDYLLDQVHATDLFNRQIEGMPPFFTRLAFPNARHLLKVAKNNTQAFVRSYNPHTYSGSLTLFKAQAQPPIYCESPDLGWAKFALGGVEIHEIPGNHHNILKKPYVEVVANKLRNCILKGSMSSRV